MEINKLDSNFAVVFINILCQREREREMYKYFDVVHTRINQDMSPATNGNNNIYYAGILK